MEVASNDNTHRSSAGQLQALSSAVNDEPDNANIFAGSDSDGDDERGYKPRPQLPQPNVNMRSLGSLIQELESGIINVDPEYQREVVWTAERMTGLIDSLMENFYIPPIILNKNRNAGMDGSTPRDTLVCVDGKQRLSSIRAFVKGIIPCHDDKGVKWWFCKTPGTKHKRVLSSEAQKMFLEKDFVAFQFTELTSDQEEDLFSRVQMGVQLTVAEKMRAKQGPWQELAKLFVEDFPAIYRLMKNRARARDFQLTLSCFSQIIEVQHPTGANGLPTLKTNYNALPKLLSNTGAVDDAIKAHLAGVWTTLTELIERDPESFTNDDKHLSGVQTFAPIEMVAATVLISTYSETRNNELLLGDIRALREAVREHFKDLRMNAPVWKFVWDFIQNLEAIRGAVDGTTVDRNKPNQASKSANKPLSILPPRNLVDMKEEKPQSRISSPKRQRTDPGPSSLRQASTTIPVHGALNSSFITDINIESSERMHPAASTKHPIFRNTFAQYGLQHMPPNNSTFLSPQLNKMTIQSPQTGPMHETWAPPQQNFRETGSVSGKTATSAYQQPPQQPQGHFSLIADFSKAAPQAYHRHYMPRTQLQDRQESNVHTPYTPEPTAQQLRQSRASGPGNYHATVAPMQPSTQLSLVSQHVPEMTQSSRNAIKISSRSPNVMQSRPTSRGAFAPAYTDRQWKGIIASASPQMAARAPPLTRSITPPAASPLATSVAALTVSTGTPPQVRPAAPSVVTPSVTPTVVTVAPISNTRKRKSITRPTPAQYEGAIDLTSDNELEEERHNLLSSFRTKPPSAPAAPAAKASTVPARRDHVVIHGHDSDEELATVKNPYEKFKNNPRAGLSSSRRG